MPAVGLKGKGRRVMGSNTPATSSSLRARRYPNVRKDTGWDIERLLDWKIQGGKKLFLAQWASAEIETRDILKDGDRTYVESGRRKDRSYIDKVVESSSRPGFSQVTWTPTWIPGRLSERDEMLVRKLVECSLDGGYSMSLVKERDFLWNISQDPYPWPEPGKDIFKAILAHLKSPVQRGRKTKRMRALFLLKQQRAVLPHKMFFNNSTMCSVRRYNFKDIRQGRAVLIQGTGELRDQACEHCRDGHGAFIGCVVPVSSNMWDSGSCASCQYAHRVCSLKQKKAREEKATTDQMTVTPHPATERDHISQVSLDTGSRINPIILDLSPGGSESSLGMMDSASTPFRPEYVTPPTSPTLCAESTTSPLGRAAANLRRITADARGLPPTLLRTRTPSVTEFLDTFPKETSRHRSIVSTLYAGPDSSRPPETGANRAVDDLSSSPPVKKRSKKEKKEKKRKKNRDEEKKDKGKNKERKEEKRRKKEERAAEEQRSKAEKKLKAPEAPTAGPSRPLNPPAGPRAQALVDPRTTSRVAEVNSGRSVDPPTAPMVNRRISPSETASRWTDECSPSGTSWYGYTSTQAHDHSVRRYDRDRSSTPERWWTPRHQQDHRQSRPPMSGYTAPRAPRYNYAQPGPSNWRHFEQSGNAVADTDVSLRPPKRLLSYHAHGESSRGYPSAGDNHYRQRENFPKRHKSGHVRP